MEVILCTGRIVRTCGRPLHPKRLHASRSAFEHFKDRYLLRQLVVQVNNRENMPMLAVFEEPPGDGRQHAQAVRHFRVVFVTNNLPIGDREARLAAFVRD